MTENENIKRKVMISVPSSSAWINANRWSFDLPMTKNVTSDDLHYRGIYNTMMSIFSPPTISNADFSSPFFEFHFKGLGGGVSVGGGGDGIFKNFQANLALF